MQRLSHLAVVLTFICLAALSSSALAEVTLPALFSNNMVLQQGMRVPIWGKAAPGEKVTVTFCEQTKETRAAEDGTWRVNLDPLTYGGPFQLIVKGTNQIVIDNVLVGEVWIGSGQSNMAWTVQNSRNASEEIAAANYPNIRLFTVARASSLTPKDDVTGAWDVCSPQTVGNFSAVLYFFGRELHKELNVPIGLIHSSWGGTPAEAWVSLEKLAEHPDTQPYVDRVKADLEKYPDLKEQWPKYNAAWNQAWTEFRRQQDEWRKAAEEAKNQGKEAPPAPVWQGLPGAHYTPSALYNAMIVPLQPFAIRGVVWYQGESNAGRAYQYRTLFPALIQCWREAWGQGDFYFYFVQLANFMAVQTDPNEASAWAELREAQTMTLSLPNTGMAVTIDIGEANDIHPKNKQDVGFRLAQWALAQIFKRDIVYSGPLYESMTVEGNKIRLRFKHVGSGLVARDGGELKGFAIAGEDRKFVWAKAQIDGDTVVVWADEVPKPVAVRYAWANNPVCNLYNKEGFPASPFRTDDWPGVTYANR
jgi:sialate O-acetylesterase